MPREGDDAPGDPDAHALGGGRGGRAGHLVRRPRRVGARRRAGRRGPGGEGERGGARARRTGALAEALVAPGRGGAPGGADRRAGGGGRGRRAATPGPERRRPRRASPASPGRSAVARGAPAGARARASTSPAWPGAVPAGGSSRRTCARRRERAAARQPPLGPAPASSRSRRCAAPIATRLTAGLREAAQLTLTAEADATALAAELARLGGAWAAGPPTPRRSCAPAPSRSATTRGWRARWSEDGLRARRRRSTSAWPWRWTTG